MAVDLVEDACSELAHLREPVKVRDAALFLLRGWLDGVPFDADGFHETAASDASKPSRGGLPVRREARRRNLLPSELFVLEDPFEAGQGDPFRLRGLDEDRGPEARLHDERDISHAISPVLVALPPLQLSSGQDFSRTGS